MKSWLCLVCSGVVIGLAAAPVHAQQSVPAVELAAAYSIYRDLTYETSAPIGWVVAPSFNVNRWFSAVVDVGGNYGGDNNGAEHAFAGGPRFRYNWTNVGIYFQILPGASVYGGATNAIVQSGLGLDFRVAPRWAIRIESAGRVGNLDGESDVRWRGSFGLVYGIGQR